MHFWRLMHHGSVNYVPWEKVTCSVDGCETKNKAHGLCQKHLRRKKKGTPLDFCAPVLDKKRYCTINFPEHPLAYKDGRVAKHRAVLFEQIGFRRVPCFWCGCGLEWKVNLFVDHKDHDRQNNHPINLVPSCNGCNAGRTYLNPNIRTPAYSIGGTDGPSF